MTTVDPALAAHDAALLRHMLATLAYRGGKAIRHAPAEFAHFRAAGSLNEPVALLAHINDLIEWAHRWCLGEEQSYRTSVPLEWPAEVDRFYRALRLFDDFLAACPGLPVRLEVMFQAPIADALTHVGQLALLRRLAGSPVLGEAYRLADIAAGRVGPEQASPRREFELDQGALWRPPVD